MILHNKVYNVFRWISNYLLPGLGTLYFALAQIWNLPYGEQIVGTITALVTFLNVLCGVSNKTASMMTMSLDSSEFGERKT